MIRGLQKFVGQTVRRREGLPGMVQFRRAFEGTKTLLVGADGIPLEDFLCAPLEASLNITI